MKVTHIVIAAIFVIAIAGIVDGREALTIKDLNKYGKVVAPNDTFEGNVFARIVEKNIGYEIQFYKTGTAVIRYGVVKEVAGVTRVTATAIQVNGKYEVVDENTVIISGNLAGVFKTNPTEIEYTIIRAYEDKDYPGVIHPTKIVSEYEKNAHRVTQIPGPGEVWYPTLQNI